MGMLKDLAKKGYLGEKTKAAAESGQGVWAEDTQASQRKREHECKAGECAHRERARKPIK